MEQQKIIINIGRQIGSGGRIIAQMLANEFRAKLYDREILNLAAKESGFSEKFFEQNDERKGFAKSLFHIHVPLLGEGNFYKNDFSQESLYQFQSNAIKKAAAEGNCVFVGRTADYVLRDNPDKTDIFITANMEDRIRRVAERHQFSEERAQRFIVDGESCRASYYNYYTGKRWGCSEGYDLCVNSSILGVEETGKLIADFIRKRFYT
ncbi:cytidylate kinase [Prevotella sp. oral taxon 376]|uniref:cytidylate kinase-like family protein n=1 Tax=Prevotella sp. oral taxon 376 TaxID=712466 RepID=UPI000D1E678D|nr:cytidylate kinase-like family protein [Prevotella sp. oral taxon 376]PTL32951.1 cytidylate kinase [Prevotella sp. oral taxon 376]